MRIGVDMLGWQDAGGKGRGIGRYLEQFVGGLIDSDPLNQYVLYSFDRFAPWMGKGRGFETRIVPCGDGPLAAAAQRLVDRNPDELDLYLVTSPFSEIQHYRPPTPPCTKLRLASILYDLIPLLPGGEFYLDSVPERRADYLERLARLQNYDLLLAISAATRRDAVERLGIRPERIANISAATRDGFFMPPSSTILPESLAALGVRQPYVLGVASPDGHKNTAGTIEAFSLLPRELSDHRLVLVGALRGDSDWELTQLAGQYGVRERLRAVGRLADEQLREAYQHCAAFAFVSHCEGFGLPILEAMQCGAPVVAGNNTSQIELAEGAGLLADTHDPNDIARQLHTILTDAGLAADLRRRGSERARTFHWPETIRRARGAFEGLPPVRPPKPLLALFCDWTGARRHAETTALLDRLRQSYTVHWYHDAAGPPHACLAQSDTAVFDYRLFDRHDRAWSYAAAAYPSDSRGWAEDVAARLPRLQADRRLRPIEALPGAA